MTVDVFQISTNIKFQTDSSIDFVVTAIIFKVFYSRCRVWSKWNRAIISKFI